MHFQIIVKSFVMLNMVKTVERNVDLVEALLALSTSQFVPGLFIEVVFALYSIDCLLFFEIIEE